jgi:hypothetical protein
MHQPQWLMLYESSQGLNAEAELAHGEATLVPRQTMRFGDPCFFAISATSALSASLRILTNCYSVNAVFFMPPPYPEDNHLKESSGTKIA